jgi:DNA-binding GntR family transcriptional regulator
MIDVSIVRGPEEREGPQSGDALCFLEKAKAVSIAVQVAGSLRNAILSGQFKPGQRLVERQLARAVGVSLATIRDALQQLDREGLVCRKPNTGTFVTDLPPARMLDMIEVRLLLEPSAMILASRNMTQEINADLRRRAEAIDQLARKNEFYQVSRADFAFHRRVWEISGNESLEKALTQLCTPMFAFLMILYSIRRQDLTARIQSHCILVDAISSGDEKRAEETCRAHILTTKSVIMNLP